MANLTLSDNAPQEAITFTLGQATVELSPGKSVETEDQVLIVNAQDHPWLDVEIPAVEVFTSKARQTLAPEDDRLTQAGQEVNPNDPKEIRKAEEAKGVEVVVVETADAPVKKNEPAPFAGFSTVNDEDEGNE